MFLIVGLGNPGKRYEKTWHSLGFLAVDEFAEKNNFPDFRLDKKSNSLVCQKDNVILAKPQTFMNKSGLTVKKLIENWKLKIENLIVVHDDADLPKGEIRISKDRGTAGHKGIESIISVFKSRNFIRIRIGVRPANYIPGSKSLDRFVLRKFAKNEEKIVAEVIKKTTEAVEMILKDDAEKAMAEFN
ncbi:MAG: Peptidyl-tRNA hydrolase [Candidatus Kaiserbacteria bacterium GW2011_GWA2_49_19]|uniref:Peptidyl-tRNA hydrolase n=1 Tax=Candidatus Kaiserbacteria bacterium GW2011_GWA2_49_19 TaxID=1618669 RepID=A0A0G1VP32_9BACT|nr:MAG: Peptidyl-tRNA hydrolase [Candidatus Kaiserbacteria bacterium GW2011_GWA2_49_19]